MYIVCIHSSDLLHPTRLSTLELSITHTIYRTTILEKVEINQAYHPFYPGMTIETFLFTLDIYFGGHKNGC